MVYRFRRSWNRRVFGQPRIEHQKLSDYFHKEIDRDVENIGRNLGNKIADELGDLKNPDIQIPPDKMKAITEKILSKLSRETLNRIAEYSDKVFRDIRDELFSRYGFKISRETMEKYLVKDLVKRILTIANDSLKEVNDESVDKLTTAMTTSVPAGEVDRIVDDMIDTSKSRYGEISRTILGSLFNEANRRGYQLIEADLGLKPEEAKYVWVNPLDYRTTETCRKIFERTKEGVTMEELTKIVKEESEKQFKGFWKEDNPLYPHYQCRSTFHMKVVNEE